MVTAYRVEIKSAAGLFSGRTGLSLPEAMKLVSDEMNAKTARGIKVFALDHESNKRRTVFNAHRLGDGWMAATR